MTDATLDDLPPSTVLVYVILEDRDRELTQDEIAEESHSNKRTVQNALYRLEDEGLVTSRTVYGDARKTLYLLDK